MRRLFARRRLLNLVDPALIRLEQIVTDSEDDRVVLAAVKEILSRAGIEPPVPVPELTIRVVEAEIKRPEAELMAEGRPLPESRTSTPSGDVPS